MSLQSVENGGAPLSVLLVEDDVHDRALYKRALNRRFPGVDISECETAAQGLKRLRAGGVDCVLLDNMLPDGEGMDVLISLRREKAATGVAVIMITGAGDEHTAVTALKMGAGDYLVKEHGMEERVARSVARAVENARFRREIESYRNRLESSHKAMSEFTHGAAHDLKAPLRRIMAYADLLSQEARDRLTEDEKGYIARLNVNAVRMRQLLDDLLVFADIDDARERREPRDVAVIVHEALDALGDMLRDSGAEVDVGEMPCVSVYPARLRQMFQNLISNAVKYRSAAPPRIAVGSAPVEGGHEFTVHDNGLGIPPESRESVFKAFRRLHSHDDIEGSGLGLSICKRVARLHGGRIWVEPALGGGSVFHFTVKEAARG